jgi:hypothetical protein
VRNAYKRNPFAHDIEVVVRTYQKLGSKQRKSRWLNAVRLQRAVQGFLGEKTGRPKDAALWNRQTYASFFNSVPIAYGITQFAANNNIASATTIVSFNAATFDICVSIIIDMWMK